MTRQKMFSRFQLLDPIEVLLTSRPHKGGEKGVVTLRPRILANPSCNARIHGRIFEKKKKKRKSINICINIYDSSIFISKSNTSVVQKENEKSKNLSSTTIVLKRRKITT